MYRGRSVRVERVDGDIAELCFDRSDGEVNKFDLGTVDELRAASAAIADAPGIGGLLVTSAKNTFIVGADIFEFRTLFAKTVEEIAAFNAQQSSVFTAFEDLPVPIVVAVNGLALGGGFEMALATDYRVMAETAQVGLPEVSLGLIPGFGGTVRLPRLCGAGIALDWITSGKPRGAPEALAAGAVDAIAPASDLRALALVQLRKMVGSGEWRSLRADRNGVVRNRDAQAVAVLKGKVAQGARHYPAPLAVIELVEASAGFTRDDALRREAHAFARIASTGTARALVQVFVNTQTLKRKGRAYADAAQKIRRAAVLGAGIMGGGIAYSSAAQGIPVLMKDVKQSAIDLGMREARRLLDKQVGSGRLDKDRAAAIEVAITPTLEYEDFGSVDVVVEAIVENVEIKKKVLAEVEGRVAPHVLIASNTSSLSIDDLASELQRPENFVGMHFFNPVPVMPLVEVVRGRRTNEASVATAVRYATAMGKTPVVLRDCPGFLVNRILNAYFVGFAMLIRDGADFARVDEVMEAFGWPMGPAYLQDVVGMDTSSHVFETLAAAYPESMALDFANPIRLMADRGRFGQKNGNGFYRYERGPTGRLNKLPAPEAHTLLGAVQPQGPKAFSDEETIDRMMIPMVLEAAKCLEEGIADCAAEIDMALILGIGFPRHYCGALAYADLLGLEAVVEKCQRYAGLGGGYQVPKSLREMADVGGAFYD
jgi:3-hydroxyacyl-CoA dehydrogenase/enoyl-CoA hydratase/3-hydroxybutyryl-CoA epimerase/enoyl-CoA isomerase